MEKNFKEYLTPPIILIFALLIISLLVMMPVLAMVILGAILAYGIRPIANKIQSKFKYSSISIILAIIIVIIPIILLFVYILLVISGAITDFLNVNHTIANLDINSYILQLIPGQNDPTNSAKSIYSFISEIGTLILNYIVDLAKKLPFIFMEVFVLLTSIFYFTRDGDKCFNFIASFIPDSSKSFFNKTVTSVQNVLKSIFYGHFLTSLIIGIIAAIGYSLLGYDYGIFLGILTGIFQLIPVIGPWPIYWALAIMDFLNGNYVRVVIVLLFGFGLSLSDMYIRPALSSHYADIHPLILLIGFLAGPLVYGIVGFILGPLILGITYAVLKTFKEERLKGEY